MQKIALGTLLSGFFKELNHFLEKIQSEIKTIKFMYPYIYSLNTDTRS